MHLSDNSLETALEPFDGLGLGDTVTGANVSLRASTLSDTLAGAGPVQNISMQISVEFCRTACPMSHDDADENTHMQQ